MNLTKSQPLPEAGTILVSHGKLNALTLDITQAEVSISHSDTPEIIIRANRQKHWSISPKGVIKQTKTAPDENTIIIDAMGKSSWAKAFFRWLFSFLGKGKNRNAKTTGISTVTMTQNGQSIKIQSSGQAKISFNNGELYVGGVKVDINAAKNLPTDPDDYPEVRGIDKLEICIPGGYKLNLDATIDEGSMELDYWELGTVHLVSTGDGTITSGDILNADSCLIELYGDGNGTFKALTAATVDLKVFDDGSLTATDISATTFTCEQTADGEVHLNKIDAAESVILTNDDDGDLTCNEVKTKIYVSSQDGDGHIHIGNLDAEDSSEFYLTDDGCLYLQTVRSGIITSEQSGDGNIEIGNLSADGAVEITMNDDGTVTVAQSLVADSLRINHDGDTDLEIHNLKVSNGIECEVTDDGGLEFGTVESRTFSSSHSGDGGLNVKKLTTQHLVLENTDDADIIISDGSTKTGVVTNTDDGNIRLSKGFRGVKSKSKGDGEIEIG
jgi:hypothetical protein